jgi:hypothetical protein
MQQQIGFVTFFLGENIFFYCRCNLFYYYFCSTNLQFFFFCCRYTRFNNNNNNTPIYFLICLIVSQFQYVVYVLGLFLPEPTTGKTAQLEKKFLQPMRSECIILILLLTNFSYQLSYQTLHMVDLIQILARHQKNWSRMFIPNPTYSRFDSRFKFLQDT